MSNEVDLVTCAYEQVGERYRAAIDVSLSTWRMFAARNAGLFAAAWYLCIKNDGKLYRVAALLLLLAAVFMIPTILQMRKNQKVIQRVLAAGCQLEQKHPDLGNLYRHAGSKCILTDVAEGRQSLDPPLSDKTLDEFGLKSVSALLACMYAGVFVGLSVLTMILGGSGYFNT